MENGRFSPLNKSGWLSLRRSVYRGKVRRPLQDERARVREGGSSLEISGLDPSLGRSKFQWTPYGGGNPSPPPMRRE